MLKDIPHTSFNCLLMKLSIWLIDRHIPGLSHMLNNLPNLEELEMNTVS